MGAELSYLRGAFIAYEPGGYPDRRRVIPFRFNPESISRSLKVDSGQTGAGTVTTTKPKERRLADMPSRRRIVSGKQAGRTSTESN